MILPTSDLRERLLANDQRRGDDHLPIVRLFNPPGAAAVVVGNVKGAAEVTNAQDRNQSGKRFF
jgi:hypothetical protein